LLQGEAWTIISSSRREKGKHKSLMDQIVHNPDILEEGLTLLGTNVLVSRDFGERGYIDLVFHDRNKCYVLAEVKVGADEIDQAIGQIMRHKKLFEDQNSLEPHVVRMAIACPLISKPHRQICESLGIRCLELCSAYPPH
jgi:RecB family endonuclease NucS